MDSHCRVGAGGPAPPTRCAPPTAQDPALAARLGNARLHTLYDQATWSEGPVWWEAQPQAWAAQLRRYRAAESTRLVWRDVLGLD
ncbi:hypothetical protein Y887_18115, partial [Xanthomonas pisi DSM 18956]